MDNTLENISKKLSEQGINKDQQQIADNLNLFVQSMIDNEKGKLQKEVDRKLMVVKSKQEQKDKEKRNRLHKFNSED